MRIRGASGGGARPAHIAGSGARRTSHPKLPFPAVVVFVLCSRPGCASAAGRWLPRRFPPPTPEKGRTPPSARDHPARARSLLRSDADGHAPRSPGQRSAGSAPRVARGGRGSGSRLERAVGSALAVLLSCCRAVLPPAVACARAAVAFYRALPADAVLAQVGLVYCFAGGYYPTLFSALQAAQHCGWPAMVRAIDDLADEATRAVEAATADRMIGESAREILVQKTKVVLATVDPTKINQAMGALYTTWMGVSSVLEREYAKTITLSVTIAGFLESVARFVVAPPVYLCVSEEYHRWVPVVIGWACKAAAMSVAWRVQRVLTASASAVAGGLMFARASARILSRRGVRLFAIIRENHEETSIDEVVGFLVAGLGLYAQIGSGFDFRVPFPLSLVTWPFDWAERWIQWQITKDSV